MFDLSTCFLGQKMPSSFLTPHQTVPSLVMHPTYPSHCNLLSIMMSVMDQSISNLFSRVLLPSCTRYNELINLVMVMMTHKHSDKTFSSMLVPCKALCDPYTMVVEKKGGKALHMNCYQCPSLRPIYQHHHSCCHVLYCSFSW